MPGPQFVYFLHRVSGNFLKERGRVSGRLHLIEYRNGTYSKILICLFLDTLLCSLEHFQRFDSGSRQIDAPALSRSPLLTFSNPLCFFKFLTELITKHKNFILLLKFIGIHIPTLNVFEYFQQQIIYCSLNSCVTIEIKFFSR